TPFSGPGIIGRCLQRSGLGPHFSRQEGIQSCPPLWMASFGVMRYRYAHRTVSRRKVIAELVGLRTSIWPTSDGFDWHGARSESESEVFTSLFWRLGRLEECRVGYSGQPPVIQM